ncbi:hypothetical protein GCM10027514_37030 [Azotobacter armeniacus]
MMRPDAKVEKVYLYPKPVDFRKSIDGLLALVEQTPDMTLAEIVAHLRARHGLSVGTTVVWKFLERQKLTYKKRRRTLPSNNARM